MTVQYTADFDDMTINFDLDEDIEVPVAVIAIDVEDVPIDATVTPVVTTDAS